VLFQEPVNLRQERVRRQRSGFPSEYGRSQAFAKSDQLSYESLEEDRMINPQTQHFMANRMKATTRSFAVDHTPLLSAPQKVVDIILEAKQAVS
jgi:hypothetical protein